MPQTLLIRLDAPLMSFGGVMIDGNGVTLRHPTLSMLTGLLGNALGYDHGDRDALARLQSRLVVAARADVPGERLVDFQTVGLDQPFLARGWTTRGQPESRAGGSASAGTAIRHRHYLADAVYTVAVQLIDPEAPPSIGDLAAALDFPRRPLFIGRKPCLPSGRLLLDVVEASTPRAAVVAAPWAVRSPGQLGATDAARVWWSDEAMDGTNDPADGSVHAEPVADIRDWHNQVHTGFRWQLSGVTPRQRDTAPDSAHSALEDDDDPRNS